MIYAFQNIYSIEGDESSALAEGKAASGVSSLWLAYFFVVVSAPVAGVIIFAGATGVPINW